MTQDTSQGRAQYIQNMFARIAPSYDLMNGLMTGRQDKQWRKQVIELAHPTPNAHMLDLGAGTGDLAREALRQQPSVYVMAADFTLEMMRAGQQHGRLDWASADALHLPCRDETFDAIVSGFLIRNVVDLDLALKEQYRALKSRGRLVILDTTRPKRNWLSPFIWAHMHIIIPLVGGLVSGFREAYKYLSRSTEGFLTAEQLASHMAVAGFKKVNFKRLMFGTIAIHWAER